MDILTHIVAWLALIVATVWVLSFWPRWVAADLGVPEKAFLLRPWMRGLDPYKTRWPFISLAFYGYLWKRGRILEFVLAAITLYMVARAASCFFRTSAAVIRSQM